MTSGHRLADSTDEHCDQVLGRIAVVLSAIGFWGLYKHQKLARSTSRGIFAVLIVISCLEKLASVLNLVSVERDWVSPAYLDVSRLANGRLRCMIDRRDRERE